MTLRNALRAAMIGLVAMSPLAYAAELGFRDRVMQVRDAEGASGDVRVVFRRHAAIYSIPKTAPKSGVLAEAARQAARSGKQVEVVVDPDRLTILRLKAAR